MWLREGTEPLTLLYIRDIITVSVTVEVRKEMKVMVEKRPQEQVCGGCGNNILPNTATVLTTMHSHKVSFHPECWVAVVEEWQQGEQRGRKRLDLTEDEKEQRLKIQHTYAVNKHRLRRYRAQLACGRESPESVIHMRIMRLEFTQKLLTMELEKLGGLPSHWVKESI